MPGAPQVIGSFHPYRARRNFHATVWKTWDPVLVAAGDIVNVFVVTGMDPANIETILAGVILTGPHRDETIRVHPVDLSSRLRKLSPLEALSLAAD